MSLNWAGGVLGETEEAKKPIATDLRTICETGSYAEQRQTKDSGQQQGQ